MNPLNQVNIEEKSTEYSVKLRYSSERDKNEHKAELKGIEEADGSITFRPWDACSNYRGFEFTHSDPDRVIAIAQMMLAFAQMVKDNNKKAIAEQTDI